MKRTLMVSLLSLGLAASAFGNGAGTKAPRHNKFAQKQAKQADKQEDKQEKAHLKQLKAECKVHPGSEACRDLKQQKRAFKAEEKAEKTAKK